MTSDQLETLTKQMERAVEILRSDASEAEKINTLERIGGICSFQGRTWGEDIFNKLVDSLNA